MLALIVKAPTELKVIPLPNANNEEFASMFKLPEDVVMPPFKVMPEFAVRATVPAAVKLPVVVMLFGAVNVNPLAAVMPPVMALKLIDVALFKETPLALAKVILSFGPIESMPLSESPFKLIAPMVVVILALILIPFMACASSEENEESA